jgi:uncharacterized membrane protein (UPF0182 family)
VKTILRRGRTEAGISRRRRRSRSVRALTAVAIAAVVIVGAVVVARLYVDWLWFGEVALRPVYWTRFWYGLALGLLFGLSFFAIVYGNIAVARRLAPKMRAFEGIDVVEFVHEGRSRRLRQVAFVVTALIALPVGLGAAGSWLTFARAFNGVPFGTTDPIFHHDLAFYVFTLPAWQYVHDFLFATLVVALIAVIVTHLVLGGIWLERYGAAPTPERATQARRPVTLADALRGIRLEQGCVIHLSSLLAALFLVGGLGYLLKAWNLLLSTSGAVFGAGYTDVNVRLPIIRALMVFALVIAAALVYNAWRKRRVRWLALAVPVWVAALIVFLGIVPAAWQALFVSPSQLTRELPYIAYDLAATRAAYDLTAVNERPYALTGDLTAASLEDNSRTVDNIRLWDPETLRRSYTQLQQLRPYYRFSTVSVDRYRLGGAYTQTMLSPRELNVDGLPAQAQTWVNRHITYTHGFGVTVSAVNQVASSGVPDFLVQDVPVTWDSPELAVTQPRIYFGLSGTDYVLVRTTFPEFDYPGRGGDVYRTYDGTGGVPIDPILSRLAFSIRFGTIKFLTTTTLTDESRVVIRNGLMARLSAAAPFLTFDSDPYMVIAHGRLHWIVDAYTTSDRVPYSQPLDGVNYIRNSVKVVVDAYNGSLRFYAFDTDDPLLRSYQRLFPDMFRPASAMDATLREHVRYPQDYFRAQAASFSAYHVTDPVLLYNKGDQWQVPTGVSISGAGEMHPYYMIMRLPGETREEFVLILPFTPNGRRNMIGWLGAQSDPPHYGEAVSFAFPANLNVYGPAQVEAAVNQDPEISAQRTLWGQTGSRVIFGNLIVAPVEDSLLYVQPLYIEAEQTRLPQVQRVIVFYRSPSVQPDLPTGQQENVVMARTLDEALAAIFGAPGGVPGAPPTGGAPNAEAARLIARASAQYEAAQAALRAGDLQEFGRQIAALGRTLEQLTEEQQAAE